MGTHFKLVLMERNFVVTETTMAEDLRDNRNERTEKNEIFAQSGYLCVLINLW